MENIEIAKQVRGQILAAMEGKGGSDNALKEALHAAFARCLGQAKGSGASCEEAAREMARGGLESFLMLAKNPVPGSVEVMRAVVESSGRLGLDTSAMMQAALAGLVRAVPKSKPDALFSMKLALDEAYTGIGEAFDEARKQAPPA